MNIKKICLVILSLFLLICTSCKEQASSSKSIAQSVELIKAGIQVKGIVSSEEAQGLNLLSKMMSGSTLDTDLVEDIQGYMSIADPSDLSKEIITLFDLVQTQGNISDTDQIALDELVRLISLDKDGQ